MLRGPMEDQIRNRRRVTRLMAVYAFAVSALAGAIYFHYQSSATIEREHLDAQLTAIVELKIEQIQAWRGERMAQGESFMRNPLIASLTHTLIQDPDDADTIRRLDELIANDVEIFGYESAILVDDMARPIWAAPPAKALHTPAPRAGVPALPPEVHEVTRFVVLKPSPFVPEFVDFYRVGPEQSLRLALIVPLSVRGAAVPHGALVLQINPVAQLGGALTRWPMPTRSGEVILLRREGDHAYAMSKLRFRDEPPGQFKLPLSQINAPAVRIAQGATGLQEGVGYAGKPTVAVGRGVPDTPWVLGARLDMDEAFESLYTEWRNHLFTFLAVSLAMGGVFAAAWRWLIEREHRERAGFVEAQLEQEARYSALFDANPHPMWIFDRETLHFLKVNDAAVRQYGYSREEFLGMTIQDIRPKEDVPRLMAHLQRSMEAHEHVGIWRHLRRDGSEILVDITRSPTTVDGRPAEIVLAHDVTERLRAEEALRKTAAALHESQRIAHLGNWDWDILTNRLHWSPEVYRIFGLAEHAFTEDANYEAFETGVHPDDRDRVNQAVHDALHQHGEYDLFHRVLWPNGEVRTVHELGTVVFDENGRATRMYGVVQDITERRMAEAALRASEERLRLALKASQQGIFDLDIASGLATVSPEYALMLDYDPADFQESFESWAARLHPDDRAATLQAQEDYLAGRRTEYRAEFRLQTRFGGWRWILSMGEIVERSADGTPRRMIGTHTDITELKNKTIALEAAQERLQRAVRAGAIGLWDFDLSTGAFEVTREWCAQLGINPEALLGTIEDWTGRLHPDDYKVIDEFTAALQHGDTAAITREFRARHEDGSYRWILGAVSILRDAEGNPRHAAGANVDITERKRLEQEFIQSQKMESVGRLAGGVAHDFNNLLAVIGGYSELTLAELPEGSHLHHDILQIKHAADRAAGLTRQLLAFSRRQVLKPEVLDVNQVIADAEKMLRRLIGEDIQFTTVLAPEVGQILADPGQIEQVLLNLVVNARDAMPRGGTIRIETSSLEVDLAYARQHHGVTPGRFVRITVTDSGCGMDKEVIRQIFEPFFTTKAQGKGTGLGLATVHGIVNQSGGTIDVTSEPGQGTTFQILFPCHEPRPAERNKAVPIGPSHGHDTIMLVEDEDAVRALTERALRKCGYSVHSASSPAKARILMEAVGDTVQLLITDVIMPGLSGPALAEQLCAKHPHLKVLYMSGYTDDALDNHGVLKEGIQLINKPFSIADLTQKIREVLDTPA